MAHAPTAPTNQPVELNLTEDTEFYIAEADAETLTEADLVPSTSGGDGFAPTRSVNRSSLHNGRDVVSVGNLQGVDTSIQVHLPSINEKMTLLREAVKTGKSLIYNLFHRDGSGQAGYLKVTSIETPTDSEAEFFHTVNVSTFSVNLIDPPAGV